MRHVPLAVAVFGVLIGLCAWLQIGSNKRAHDAEVRTLRRQAFEQDVRLTGVAQNNQFVSYKASPEKGNAGIRVLVFVSDNAAMAAWNRERATWEAAFAMVYDRHPRQGEHMARAYDVEMIEDFLSHLKWSLIANHLELQNPCGETVKCEVVETLTRHIKKRATGGLLFVHRLKEEANVNSLQEWVSERQKLIRQSIESLENLQPVLEEAYTCARTPNAILVKEIG